MVVARKSRRSSRSTRLGLALAQASRSGSTAGRSFSATNQPAEHDHHASLQAVLLVDLDRGMVAAGQLDVDRAAAGAGVDLDVAALGVL